MNNITDSKPAYERYQEKPFFGSSHYWATEQLLKMPRTSRILDVGSGSGTIGTISKNNNFTYCAAVEIDPATLEKTKSLYNRIELDLSSYNDDKFDIIFLLDILEHIPNINVFFDQIIALLNPSGRMFISLPNIAHWSVRLPLLFGHFEYRSRGILDRTHLHFFNRKRALSFINQHAQLKLLNYSTSIPPLEFVLPKWAWNNPIYKGVSFLHYQTAQFLPGFFGYQHLMSVEKVA